MTVCPGAPAGTDSAEKKPKRASRPKAASKPRTTSKKA